MAYKTMQGKEIDMDKLVRNNELVPAVGNMRVNARGDMIGPGGVIVKKREDVIAEYYETNPNAKTVNATVPAEPVVNTESKPAATVKKTTTEE